MSVVIDLTGKSALITGASQGIGAAIARRFHAAGCRVFLNHSGIPKAASDAKRLADELNTLREKSVFVLEADVSSQDAVQAMMERLSKEWGELDFLINNAAILRDRSVGKMSSDEWHDVVKTNLDGVFFCCKYGLEIMREGGAIVSMSSISALVGFFGQGNYAAAKAGVVGLSKVLARESGNRNIRVNVVAPGVVETAMSATIPEKIRAEMLKNVPLGRFAQPEEIADGVLFLCSPMASYINGQTLEINGGWRG